MAGLASSPVVWPHYFVLVSAAIALISPRLSPLWLMPLVAYLAPVAQTHGDIWKILPYIALEVMTVAALCFWPAPGELAPSAQPSPGLRRRRLLGTG